MLRSIQLWDSGSEGGGRKREQFEIPRWDVFQNFSPVFLTGHHLPPYVTSRDGSSEVMTEGVCGWVMMGTITNMVDLFNYLMAPGC